NVQIGQGLSTPYNQKLAEQFPPNTAEGSPTSKLTARSIDKATRNSGNVAENRF
ncbi:hypothetical protein Pmar_PMAR022213, partial [Perkinsus marinus ATCC 50983]